MTELPENLYDILGASKDATMDQIKAAFKKKAKAYHPDQGGNQDDFIKLKKASKVLLNPHKRKLYDDGIEDNDDIEQVEAFAMQRIVEFFVNSINNPMIQDVERVDYIKGATKSFNDQISQCGVRIRDVKIQVDRFEKVIKRLKTNRQQDVLTQMLVHHASKLRSVIHANEKEKEVFKTAIQIINDYQFDKVEIQFIGIHSPYGGIIR
jgi:curved DNA-binding protein CbpA